MVANVTFGRTFGYFYANVTFGRAFGRTWDVLLDIFRKVLETQALNLRHFKKI